MTPSVVVVTFSLGSTGSAVAPQGSLLELDNGKTDFGARDDKASAVSGGVRDDKASSAPLLSPAKLLLGRDCEKTDFGARDDKASAVSGGVRDDKASSAPLLSPTGSGVERLLFVDLGLAKLLGVLAREPWLN